MNPNTTNKLIRNLTNIITNYKLAGAAGRRRRRRVNTYNPMSLHIGKRTSALGSERRTALLTGLLEENCSNKKQINLASVFSSGESLTVLRNWLYVKILSVSVTYEPNNLNTSSRPLYMSVIWTNEEPQYLSQMNNVKIVPAYRVGFKSYTFRVPTVESSALTLNKWKSPGDLQSCEFYLYLHSPGNTDTWYIRIDIKVLLSGSKIFNVPTTLVSKPLPTEIIEEQNRSEDAKGD